MSPIRFIARPMLAAGYILNGVDRLRRPEPAAASVGPLLNQARKQIDVPVDATTLARATGVAQVAAGSLLAIGRFPRISASILVGTATAGMPLRCNRHTSG